MKEGKLTHPKVIIQRLPALLARIAVLSEQRLLLADAAAWSLVHVRVRHACTLSLPYNPSSLVRIFSLQSLVQSSLTALEKTIARSLSLFLFSSGNA